MKIVLSGSSSGIGRFLTAHFLARGDEVWGLARSDQNSFAELNPRFRSTRCDVADWPQVVKAAAEIGTAWGSIDAIIASAGIQGSIGPAMHASPTEWSQTIRANLDGTFFLLRGLFSILKPSRGRAKIMCFSGGGSTSARPNFSAYGVAKTAIVRLVETLAAEWAGTAIDVNAIAPGAIYTRLTEEVIKLGAEVVGEKEYQAALKQNPDPREALEKVAKLVEFLLSANSDGITGRLLSAPWDPWPRLDEHRQTIATSDVYTLRRILPSDRKLNFEGS